MAADSPSSDWADILRGLRASPADLDVRPSRWETRMTLPLIERELQDPVSGAREQAGWSAELGSARSSAELLGFAAKLLDSAGPPSVGTAASSSSAVSRSEPPAESSAFDGLPRELSPVLERLVRELGSAQEKIERAASSLNGAEREKVLAAAGDVLRHEEFRRPAGSDYDTMARFDYRGMLQGALAAARAVDEALPELARASGRAGFFLRTRRRFPFGDVLVSDDPEESYEGKDLDGVVLLVRLGRKTLYRAPVAAAGPGRLRVVIDMGRDIVVENSTAPTAGSGIFGVGLLYIPAAAQARLSAGDYSLGAGLFGVGGVFVGGASVIEGGRFAEGAGAFGAGILEARGEGARHSVRFAGQGFGFTRGAGLFLQRGGGAVVEGGLYYPDPRDPLALLSLCQGVGYGPRAFAAGGFGLAFLEGGGSTAKASYFSQGSGYWHGLGALYVKGDGNRLQARRYSQGAGIHAAAGALFVEGGRNRTVNWGVGPGFGWDYGIGRFEARGDGNSFHADWAGGRGDINGHALVSIRGDSNTLTVADLGTGFYRRAGPSYGLADVSGRGNRVRVPGLAAPVRGAFDVATGPWGVIRGEGELSLDGGLEPAKADWPSVDRRARAGREKEVMGKLLAEAGALPPPERVAQWLFVASALGLDPASPEEAAGKLAGLRPEEAPLLVAALSPERFDEFLWVRLVLSAFGKEAARAIREEMKKSVGLRRLLLLGLLRGVPAREAVGPALQAIRSADWRERAAAAAVLGYLLDSQAGEEPGRLRVMEQARALAARSGAPAEGSPEEAEALRRLGHKRLQDLFSILAAAGSVPAADRFSLLAKSASPFDFAEGGSLREFLRLAAGSKACAAALSRELAQSRALRGRARRALLAAAGDKDPDARTAALTALGQIGDARDAPVLSRALQSGSTLVREAAAAALGKMGRAGRPALARALASGRPGVRALAVLGLAQSSDAAVLAELRPAFADPAPEVRLAAAASLAAFQGPYLALRKDFLGELRRLAAGDISPSVRASAAYAAAQIAP